MGREWKGAGTGKVNQISSISYCLGWGMVHGEMDTKKSHQVLLSSTLLLRHGPPTTPLPKFLPCFGKWAHILWVTRSLPWEQAEPPCLWACLPGPLPGSREEGCVYWGRNWRWIGDFTWKQAPSLFYIYKKRRYWAKQHTTQVCVNLMETFLFPF